MELTENTVVAGRFRLNRLLGQGGMGAVWHATHLGLDIPCAVKFIDTSVTDLYGAQARFTREARAAAQLRSPHVVQILDHGVWEGTPYIAMELLEGEDLAKRLARLHRISPPELYAIVTQVCRALTKAHAVGIVHRDLKPENIYLVRDDDREIAKVLDFGIAKQQVAELSGTSTRTGAMLGTPQYMSPEQAKGTKTVDGRSDLWSLAVIAYQALTGEMPFTSEALGELILKIVIEELPVPSAHGPVPPGFDAWWKKAVSRDPAERFQSARDFADSLALICGVTADLGRSGASAVAKLTSDGDIEAAPPTDREPHPVSDVSAASAASAPWGRPDAIPAATPPPLAHAVEGRAIPKRRRPMLAIVAACGVVGVLAVGLVIFLSRGARPPDTTFVGVSPAALPAAASPAPAHAVDTVPPQPSGSSPEVPQPVTPPTGTAQAPPPSTHASPPLPPTPQPASPAVAAPAKQPIPKKPGPVRPRADMGF